MTRLGVRSMGLALIVTLVAHTADLRAQQVTQQISLRAGWNSIFLEVQPEPRGVDELLQGLPIESVWMSNDRFSSVEFIDDPNELVPKSPDWLTYFPPGSRKAAASNLFTMQGGRGYLIQVSEDLDWEVQGMPVITPPRWRSEAWALRGFPVRSDPAPTFGDVLGDSLSHQPLAVIEVSPDGNWEPIKDPSSERVTRGRAYLIYSREASSYSGPIEIVPPEAGRINFGRALFEQNLRIRNVGSADTTVSLRTFPSETLPEDSNEVRAGGVPLSYRSFDDKTGKNEWVPLENRLELTLAAGEEFRLRLEVRRRDMTPADVGPGKIAVYQSLLEVSDESGMRVDVPVCARGMTPPVILGGGGAQAADAVANCGLWVGAVVVNKVSYPRSKTPNAEVPTASEFQFRLIIHVDANGDARVLRDVLQMWSKGTTREDPDNPGAEILDEPGRFVLLTRRDLVKTFTGATVRDGVSVGRRISSAAFSHRTPIDMKAGGEFGSEVEFEVTTGFDDPLNPFKHKFHPGHDNKGPRYDKEPALAEGKESFEIGRRIKLNFTSEDPEGLPLPGYGDGVIGGIFSETIEGLHRRAIRVKGTFRLHRVSRIAVLNDG